MAAALAGLALLAVVGLLLVLLRVWRGQPAPADDVQPPSERPAAPIPEGVPDTSEEAEVPTGVYDRRQVARRAAEAHRAAAPNAPPVAATPDPADVAAVVRSLVLQAVAERSPLGSHALVLSPPPHRRQMTWHVHLGVDVSLDLLDGRTVPTAPPPSSHDWKIPSGRTIELAVGDPTPAPGPETQAVRAAGAYVSVTYQSADGGSFLVRALGAGGGTHEYRAPADSPARLEALLGQALPSVLRPVAGDETTMGYAPPSWNAHERTWLAIRAS